MKIVCLLVAVCLIHDYHRSEMRYAVIYELNYFLSYQRCKSIFNLNKINEIELKF